MVQRDDGNWYRVDSPPQAPLQWPVALMDFRRYICLERSLVHCISPHIYLALRFLPWNLVCNDPPSGTIALPRYLPYGLSNNRGYDRLRRCACLGTLGYLIGEYRGSMVEAIYNDI